MKFFFLLLFLLWSLPTLYGAVDLRSDYEFISSTKKGAIPHRLSFDFDHTKGVIGGWLEIDKNCYLDSPIPRPQYAIRRARLYLDTITYDYLEFMLMGEMRFNRINYHYLYIDTLKPNYFRIRAGLFKKPFSLEALYSTRYLWMVNRSLGALNYQHFLDIGIEAYGTFWKERFEWGLGLFNGNRRNLKYNPHKNVCGRLDWRPHAENKKSIFHKLRFGVSFQTSQKKFTLAGLSTGTGTPFLSWNNVKTRAKRNKLVWGGDIEWLYGPAALRTETLLVNWDHVTSPQASVPFTGYSWYVQGSYLLTGEDQKHNLPLFPKTNFSFCKGGGAVEVTARYEIFQADQKVVQAHLATGSTFVSGFTLGTNYYFNPFLQFRFNWQKSNFHKKIKVKNRFTRDESVLTFLFQGEF